MEAFDAEAPPAPSASVGPLRAHHRRVAVRRVGMVISIPLLIVVVAKPAGKDAAWVLLLVGTVATVLLEVCCLALENRILDDALGSYEAAAASSGAVVTEEGLSGSDRHDDGVEEGGGSAVAGGSNADAAGGSETAGSTRPQPRPSTEYNNAVPSGFAALRAGANHRWRRSHRRITAEFLRSAAQATIDRLPLYIFQTRSGGVSRADDTDVAEAYMDFDVEKGNKLECPICIEVLKAGEKVRILPCMHQFHAECVDQWLLDNAVCPTCKYSIL